MNKGMIALAAVAFVSLLGNLYAVGYVIGRDVARQKPYVQGPQGRVRSERQSLEFTLRGLAQGLSEEGRQEVRRRVRERREALRPVFTEMRRIRRRITLLMRAQTIDEEALTAAFQRLRELNAELQTPLHEALVDVAADLSQEDRQNLLDRMEAQRAQVRRRLRDRRP